MSGTVLGRSFVIKGEITSEEDVVVHGAVNGKLQTRGNLLIEKDAVVEADVESSAATIGGQLKGNLSAIDRVELRAEGRMVGSIRSPRIHIAEGAAFKGRVDMDI